jgi:hypothetical protein
VAVNNILVVSGGYNSGVNNSSADTGSEETRPVGKIVVLSDHEVKSVPLQRCASVNIQRCEECVGLQDPYCAWNLQSQRCEDHQTLGRQLDGSSLLQSLYTGLHSGCPSSRHGKFSQPK